MSTKLRKAGAILLAGAIVMGGMLSAQTATAAPISGNPTFTITPSSGNAADAYMFTAFDTSVGCPAGFQGASTTAVFQGGVRLSNISQTRNSASAAYDPDGAQGLDGQPVHMDNFITDPGQNLYVASKALSAVPGLVAGAFELRWYCNASGANPAYATEPYIPLALVLNADGTWNAPAAPPVTVATTTSLTATPNQAAKTVALSATVKKASDSSVLTSAAGTVTFKEGATTLGTGTVASGIATFTTGALTAGAHTFTAEFASTDVLVTGSTSATASANINGDTSGSTIIDVTIPAGIGSVSLSGVPATASLGTATLVGGQLVASGAIHGVTVTDTRQIGSPNWVVTGQVSDFTAGAKTLDGKYLGWAPALEGSNNAGVAGATVAPGAGQALKQAQVLSTGAVVDGKPTTVAGAALNLAAPANTPAGAYTATLTLTLS